MEDIKYIDYRSFYNDCVIFHIDNIHVGTFWNDESKVTTIFSGDKAYKSKEKIILIEDKVKFFKECLLEYVSEVKSNLNILGFSVNKC